VIYIRDGVIGLHSLTKGKQAAGSSGDDEDGGKGKGKGKGKGSKSADGLRTYTYVKGTTGSL
jgi:hypothetical protein